MRPTRAEVDLGAIVDNVALLARVSGAAVCAVVKADAYGHGAVRVARALEDSGRVAALAVSLVEEGVELRDAGVQVPVLVMGPAQRGGHAEMVARELTPVVSDPGDLDALGALGRSRGRPVAIHVKVDSGMGRLGIAPDALVPLIERAVAPGSGVAVEGICTHFASADLPDLAAASLVTLEQLAVFDRALAAATLAGAAPRVVHASNSAAILRFPDAAFAWVRPGIALYGNGLAPAPEEGALRQAMTLVSEIVQLRQVPAGQAVGYGGLWRAARASTVAVLPVGYADGLARRLTGVAEVLVSGKRCPVVGAISMDIALVDVTSLGDDARVGDAVVLLGPQGQERITAAELATRAGLLEYEITCGVSRRVPRTYR